MRQRAAGLIFVGAIALILSGCGSSSPMFSGGDSNNAGRVFTVNPGPNASAEMVAAMVDLRPGDTLAFGCGYFELDSGIQINGTEDVTVKGCGINETVLSFKNSRTQEGVSVTNVRGITVEGLTVLDSPGDGFKLKGVDHGTLRHVRAIWSSGRNQPGEDTITAANYPSKLNVACTQPARENPANPLSLPGNTTSPDYTVSVAAGRYGIYPVESRNILVEFTESIGASDAGIYVGQTNNAIIRNSRAAYNVFGFEIENVQSGEYVDNIAECNTGGFLVYDLDGLTQYGKRARVTGNIARNNNSYNFAEPGTIVANVPRGSGLITLAYDKIDIVDNVFENNDTGGIIITSYDVLGVPGDRRLDMYSEPVHIRGNTFTNNGNNLPLPDVAALIATGGEQVSTAFPLIIGLKSLAGGGQYRGGHVIWDGIIDPLDADCGYPVNAQGQPVPADEDGKPILTNLDPNPSCRYNAYKFDQAGERITPKWWFACIAADNQFAGDSEDYLNFNGLRGLESVFALTELDIPGTLLGLAQLVNFPGSFDISENDCPARFGSAPEAIAPVVIPPFVPSGNVDPAPSQSRIDELCGANITSGNVNFDAAAEVNCPLLSQYHLFAVADDPTSLPNGNGVPYVLNSKLFSDYSVKHRVVFMPPGTSALYRDVDQGVNQTVVFPVGTVIAKTFSFTNEPTATETDFETRLLIKRQRSNGQVFWDGLEYIWGTENGQRVARLSQGGGTASASWDYFDVDSNVRHTGQTANYQFPNASQCLACHANDDNETGSAPIGPKVRNLNRPYASESPLPSGALAHPVVGQNQIAWWCNNGLLSNCPSNLTVDPITQIANVARVPIFNKPGDGGELAGSKADIERRARAYLEVNCAHCHNPQGNASNTGMYVDVVRPVNGVYGICKGPTATGTEGRGGRSVDIHPARADDSILVYRMGPEAQTVQARMPPLARSVVHDEAVALMTQWINTVVDASYEDADACGSGGGGGLIPGLPIIGGLLGGG